MDIENWFAPECADDADPSELGMIQHDGEWYSPGEVLEFISRLHALVNVAEEAKSGRNGPTYGQRETCVKCETDIEFVGVEPDPAKAFLNIDHGEGWWDRGGNFSCPVNGTHVPDGDDQ